MENINTEKGGQFKFRKSHMIGAFYQNVITNTVSTVCKTVDLLADYI